MDRADSSDNHSRPQASGAVPALIEALKDREEFVRRAAAGAIYNVDPDRAARLSLGGGTQD